MARRKAPVQVNEFTGGLNTEFNPLSMPPNISIDEQNMVITQKGSRRKRFGFDFEPNHTIVSSGVSFQTNELLGYNMVKWENAGGDAEKSLLAVQVGNYFSVYDLDTQTPVSSNLVYEETFDISTYSNSNSFAVVDGLLVMVNGDKPIYIYTYEDGVITKREETLLIRDQFGVQATVSGVDLTKKINLGVRPETLTDEHLYNLRNQTYAISYKKNNDETVRDTILSFHEDSVSTKYPSNTDSILPYVYADSGDSNSRTSERFFSKELVPILSSSDPAPIGYFIIDALERGSSRLEAEQRLREQNTNLNYFVVDLPEDTTPGGATTVQEFAGRIWYSGFSGKLIGGDSKSPRMSSYVLFSSLVKDTSDLVTCYQISDPTSSVDPTLVDTDGGFIRLDEAYDITRMVVLNNSLFVFAANGVWRIGGDEGSNFTATSYQAEKITDFGTVSANSVVVSNGTIFYWGEKGINSISRNEFGFWDAVDISEKTIQTLYDGIPEEVKRTCFGNYDIYQKQISWVYADLNSTESYSEELILNLNYNAFTYNRIPTSINGLPLVVGVSESEPYKLTTTTEDVFAGGIAVTDESLEVVTASIQSRTGSLKESIYLVLTQLTPQINFSFGYYSDRDFYDWVDVDYDAYIVSSAFTGGDGRYRKQAGYLTLFMEKTEDGFNADLTPTNSSSCMLSSQWDWTVSTLPNKWSTPRQAYRPRGVYFPTDINDEYNNGVGVIATKNKIRGWGHAVSFRFASEPGKNLHLHGWSFTAEANKEE